MSLPIMCCLLSSFWTPLQKVVSRIKLPKTVGKQQGCLRKLFYPSQLTNSASSVTSMWVYVKKRHWLAKAENDSSAPSSGQQACNLCIPLLTQHHNIYKAFCVAEVSVLPETVKRINWWGNWQNMTAHLGRSRYGLANVCTCLLIHEQSTVCKINIYIM